MMQTDVSRVAQWQLLRKQIADAKGDEQGSLLAGQAQRTRRLIVSTIAKAGQGHVGGDLSVTDILTSLFFRDLSIDPSAPQRPDRDRLILSKGHCSVALYSTLAGCGFFPVDELSTFMAPMSPLNGHPNRTKVPGVETNTGPLGHGLPVGVGAALGARLTGLDYRVVVVTGDGEMQEGSNWEALMAGAQYQLSNLVLIIDRNRLQQGARTEDTNGLDPLDDKLRAFGWETRSAGGHDFAALAASLQPSTTGGPVAVIARTIKGKGVSFMEDRVEWHHKVPTAAQVEQALEELA